MNRRYSALAVSALAMGAVAMTATEASAQPDPGSGKQSTAAQVAPPAWPDEGSGYPGSGAKSPEYNHPEYNPRYEVARVASATNQVTSDDNGVEAMQAARPRSAVRRSPWVGCGSDRRRHVLAT